MTVKTNKGCAPQVVAIGAAIVLSMLLQLSLATSAHAQSEDADAIQRLRDGRHVLMLRHANAPGTGDPAQFQLRECATQRNLDDGGRAQARAIGAWLRSKGIAKARVYSSQWCRCLETAALLGIGKTIELPGLNSFYELRQNRESNLRAVREFLASRPRGETPIVMVTHQVTISELTNSYVSPGEGVLVEVTSVEPYTVSARMRFGN